jgi:hypothetical protein
MQRLPSQTLFQCGKPCGDPEKVIPLREDVLEDLQRAYPDLSSRFEPGISRPSLSGQIPQIDPAPPNGSRRLLTHGFHEDPDHDWRASYRMVFDGGCDFWWFDFSLADQRVVAFNCQGNP